MDILISGASTGIGRTTAVHLARQGHNVWAGVRTQKAFDDLTKAHVRGLQPIFLDVCDEKSISESLSHIKKTSGTLHGLVNNAGVAVGGPIEGVKLADWRRQFETNVFGPVRLIQECLPLLRESKGRIVNVSSVAGRIASPFLGPYSSSKFALESISDSLRRELIRQGIKVSLVEPGPVATPFWEKSKTEGLQKIGAYDSELQNIYATSLEKFRKRLELAEKNADPAQIVVKAIEHALTSRLPRTRYPVGRGISFSIFLSRFIPDSWFDRLLMGRT